MRISTVAGFLLAASTGTTAFAQEGVLDPTFGIGGMTLQPGPSAAPRRAVVQADDRIVVVSGDALMRFRADGTPDATFGAAGRVSLASLQISSPSVAVQPDGKIVVAGDTDLSLHYDLKVARYTASGMLDPTFAGGNGVRNIDFSPSLEIGGDVFVRPDGKILVVGSISDPVSNLDVGIARLNPDGSFDTSFGTNGLSVQRLPVSDFVVDAMLQPDGLAPFVNGFMTVRFHRNGTLDTAFGSSGVALVQLRPSMSDVASAVVVQSSGRIVVVGSSTVNSPPFSPDWGLIGLTGTPAHALTFFLNGDGAGTSMVGPSTSVAASAYTMSGAVPAPQTVSLFLPDGATWTSEETLTGTLAPGAAMRLHLACTPSLIEPKRIQVHVLSPDRTTGFQVATVTHRTSCTAPVTVNVPLTIAASMWLNDQPLRVTISGQPATMLDLDLGADTFLEVPRFFGTP